MTKPALASAVLLLLLVPAAFADSADLTLELFPPHADAEFSVLNNGPDVAHDLVLTIDVPPQLEVELGPGRPSDVCDVSVRPIRCTRATLATDEDMRVLLFLQAPAVNATYTVSGKLESGTPDPQPENNSVSATFTPHLIADFSTRFEPSLARVEPGAVQVIHASVSNFVASTPRDIRIHFQSTNATIEALTPSDPLFTCSITSATTALCTGDHLDSYCRCLNGIDVTLRAGSDRNGGEAKLEVDVESDLPQSFPDTDTATLQLYRMIDVTNIADAGPGSLRDAIQQANTLCRPGPCKVAFEIPPPIPAEGWFTITPASELPPITADRVVVDGTTQSRLTGDTNPLGPEIAIEGYLAGRGLEIYSPCDAVVQGLSIGHFFGGDGLIFSPGTCGGPGDRKEVSGNYIGVDPTGTKARPNQRGLNLNDAAGALVHDNVISRNKWSGIWQWSGSARIIGNRIEDNGKSGIVLGPDSMHAWIEGNTIHRQAEMGVAVAPGAQLFVIRGNSMQDNGGLGIDIGIDDRSPVDADDEDLHPSNAPVLLSAVYDATRDRTVLTLSLHSKRLGPFISTFQLDVYANRGPDGDGEQWLGTSYIDPGTSGSPFTVQLFGNFRGKWLNATSTRAHTAFSRPPDDKGVQALYGGEGASTSELSNAVLVQ